MALGLVDHDPLVAGQQAVQADGLLDLVAQRHHRRHRRLPQGRAAAAADELDQQRTRCVATVARLADEPVVLHGREQAMDGAGGEPGRAGDLGEGQLGVLIGEAAQDRRRPVDGLHPTGPGTGRRRRTGAVVRRAGHGRLTSVLAI